MDYIYNYNSPLGKIIIASDENAVIGLWFEGQKHFGKGLTEEYQQKALPIFEQTVNWLDIYFSGKAPDFTPKLSIRGSEFGKAVCKIMMNIPYGETITYGELAAEIAKKRDLGSMSAQAVGGAVGRNPISIIIPCHRVVGTNGSLTGYAGGLDKKKKLLVLEKTGSIDGKEKQDV